MASSTLMYLSFSKLWKIFEEKKLWEIVKVSGMLQSIAASVEHNEALNNNLRNMNGAVLVRILITHINEPAQIILNFLSVTW